MKIVAACDRGFAVHHWQDVEKCIPFIKYLFGSQNPSMCALTEEILTKEQIQL